MQLVVVLSVYGLFTLKFYKVAPVQLSGSWTTGCGKGGNDHCNGSVAVGKRFILLTAQFSPEMETGMRNTASEKATRLCNGLLILLIFCSIVWQLLRIALVRCIALEICFQFIFPPSKLKVKHSVFDPDGIAKVEPSNSRNRLPALGLIRL